MIITTTILLIIIGVCVIALAVGHFSQRNEIYFLGVILLFFTGMYVAAYGLSEPLGQTTSTNQTMTGDDTYYSTSSTIIYETVQNAQNTAIGLALLVLAAGLSLEFYRRNEIEKNKKSDSIEVLDE